VTEESLSAAYRRNVPASAHLSEETCLALVDGTLAPPEREAALDHVTRCETCARVYQGLLEFDRESRALRAPAASAPRARRSFYVPTSIAALLVMGVAAALFFRPPPPAPAGEGPTTSATSVSRGVSAEPIELLPVRVSESRALILRRPGGSSEAFLKEFNLAIEPYRSGHFIEAVDGLAALGTRFPDAPEPPLYEGVARLLSNSPGVGPAAAIGPLDRAVRLAKGSEWLPDAEYYAARARLASGREDEGRQILVRLCAASGPYQTQACRAAGRTAPGRGR
jgi:hypothetical protein